MKTITLLGLAAAAGFSTAHGAVIASEDFQSYADGNFVGPAVAGDTSGGNGGTGWTGRWNSGNPTAATSGQEILGGAVVYTGSGNQFAFRDFPAFPTPAAGTTATRWLSVDFQRSGSGGFRGVSLFRFPPGNGGSAEQVLIGGLADTNWSLGANGSTAGQQISSEDASTLRTGVVRFTIGDGNNGSAELWVAPDAVTPVDVSGAPVATFNGLDIFGVNSLRIGSNGGQTVDNIIIGETAADVGAVVPEPSSIGLLCLAFLGAFRRRRS